MNGIDGQTTGDARVDAALARFDELAAAPLDTHPDIFDDVHRRLQDTLTGIEPGPPGPGGPAGGDQDGEAAREPDGVVRDQDPHRRELPPDAEGDAHGWLGP